MGTFLLGHPSSKLKVNALLLIAIIVTRIKQTLELFSKAVIRILFLFK